MTTDDRNASTPEAGTPGPGGTPAGATRQGPEGRTWPTAFLMLEFKGTAAHDESAGDRGPDWESDVLVLDCFGASVSIEFTEDDHLRKLGALCFELAGRRQAVRERRRKAWADGSCGFGEPGQPPKPARMPEPVALKLTEAEEAA